MEQQKVIRPRNYLYELLVIMNGLVLIIVWWLILHSARKSILAGCLSYLIIAWVLRLILQKHHMQGMRFMHARKYSDAASAFIKSEGFFEKHPSIDRFRFITMFSSSAIPYRQMALNNLGICYIHMGDSAKALETFKKLADVNIGYPDIANTIEAIQLHINNTSNP